MRLGRSAAHDELVGVPTRSHRKIEGGGMRGKIALTVGG